MTSPTEAVYGTGSGHDLLLDIYAPAENTTRTAVLLLHGGGWRFGDRKMMTGYGLELAKHGFTALSVEYRLTGEAPWPAQIEDVKAAIRWTRANAEALGIDPLKIAVQGCSAGGHLALIAGGTPELAAFEGAGGNAGVSSAVAAVISFFAPTTLVMGMPGPAAMLFGPDGTPEMAAAASPTSYISANFPPAFLANGTEDRLVDWKVTQSFYSALVEAGAPADLHLYHGHTHEFCALPSMLPMVQAEIALFLQRAVVDPEKYRAENLELNMFAKPGGFPPPPPP